MKLDILKIKRLQARMHKALTAAIPQYKFKIGGGTMSATDATLKVTITPRVLKRKSKRP